MVRREPARTERAHRNRIDRCRAAPLSVAGQPAPLETRAALHARRKGISIVLWHSRAIALSRRPSLQARRQRYGIPSRLRAGGIEHRLVWRQLQLARTDLVSGQFSP